MLNYHKMMVRHFHHRDKIFINRRLRMLLIHLFALLGILLFALSYMGTILNRKLSKYGIFILLLAAFSLRLLAAALSKGFDNDKIGRASCRERV